MSHPSLKLNPTTKDMDKVRMIANIIVESIRESDKGLGVPAGPNVRGFDGVRMHAGSIQHADEWIG